MCDCRSNAGSNAGEAAGAPTKEVEKKEDSGKEHFCPWSAPHSIFTEAGAVVDFGRGQTVCMDTILYGYDLAFEGMQLWRRTKWLGVSMQQDPNDAQMIQEMLWRVKPDVLIELGTNTGGGALYFASIMSLMSPHGRVITIDPRGMCAAAGAGPTCRAQARQPVHCCMGAAPFPGMQLCMRCFGPAAFKN